MSYESLLQELQDMKESVRVLRAEADIRRIMARYMLLCDVPLPEHGLNGEGRLREIVSLFAEDARWEGVGEYYDNQFGARIGHGQIYRHFQRIFQPSTPQLILICHYLTCEQIHVTGEYRRRTMASLPAMDRRRHFGAAIQPAQQCVSLRGWHVEDFTLPDGERVHRSASGKLGDQYSVDVGPNESVGCSLAGAGGTSTSALIMHMMSIPPKGFRSACAGIPGCHRYDWARSHCAEASLPRCRRRPQSA